MKAATKSAYRLMHEGAIALAGVEANGMRVDTKRLDATIADVSSKIKKIEAKLKDSKPFKIQNRIFKHKTKISSRQQLAKVLFDEMGFASSSKTKGGKNQLNEAVLEKIGTKYTKNFLKFEKLNKLRSTYLRGVKKEVEGEFIHPFFNLHLVISYRSSSDSINFQNIPIRDPAIGKMIRSCFIPRKNHRIVEVDISGAEVRVSACYHNDPTMRKYILDPSTDMHRDMAKECFLIDEVPKPVRQVTKGGFVFAQFYGDYYVNCANNLREEIRRQKLVTNDGIPMLKHLKSNGIKSPTTFENHIKKVEHAFWNERFSVYNQWKKDWFAKYERTGGFSTLTGFRHDGIFNKKEVTNYPIQGSAFHCLLWALIKIQKWLIDNSMKTKIVGQIHDSIVADVHKDEIDDFLAYVKQVMTVDLPQAWKWITVPIVIDAEASDLGGNWFEKKEIKF